MPAAVPINLPAINARDKSGLAWDELTLDNEVFPEGGARLIPHAHGKVEVDPKLGRDLGSKKTGGKDGHRIIDKGMKPATVKITLTVWDDIGYRQLGRLIGLFQPRKRIADRRPLTIDYPSTRAAGITSIVIGEMEGPKPVSGLQGAIAVTLNCMEYTPPAKRQNHRAQTVVAAPIAAGVFDPTGGGTRNAPNQQASAFNFVPNVNP